MKELSTEKKAKAYDEAIKIAKEYFNSPRTCFDIEQLCNIFPELAESEDERIRKEIISYLKRRLKMDSSIPAAIGYWIDWLEKQAEQSPSWSEEDETGLGDALWAIQQARTIAKDENDMGNLWYAENWLKTIKDRIQPKQEWSEDDERYLNNTISYLKDATEFKETAKLCIDWLKSLKPQPKQWWNEEDEKKRKCLIKGLEDRMGFGWASDSFSREEYIDWLKSLRPQNTWKPSDEQIKLLREVQQALLGKDCHNRFVDFMYEVKRLREE